jgi:hypothetical protein
VGAGPFFFLEERQKIEVIFLILLFFFSSGSLFFFSPLSFLYLLSVDATMSVSLNGRGK